MMTYTSAVLGYFCFCCTLHQNCVAPRYLQWLVQSFGIHHRLTVLCCSFRFKLKTCLLQLTYSL